MNPSLNTGVRQNAAPADVAALIASGNSPRLVDVRTPLEYAEVHATGAVLVPLDSLNAAALGEAPTADSPVYLLCKSGARAAKAREKLAAAGCEHCIVVEGGTDAWLAAGLAVTRAGGVISMERQVRIAAGSLVLIGAILGFAVHPGFFSLCAFVGAGLVFAGVTNFCGMGLLIARMPWNRSLTCTKC
jgi:rhodanese-related sulfurtransferase